MDKPAVVAKWAKLLGLRGWTFRFREEPPPVPSRHAAVTDYVYALKEADLWVTNEREVIHELCHILIAGLDDVFWQAQRTKALDALWKRREEQVMKRLENILLRLARKD